MFNCQKCQHLSTKLKNKINIQNRIVKVATYKHNLTILQIVKGQREERRKKEKDIKL